MADALVEHSERAGLVRFFCHHCNVEFEDILQEYVCPYCSGGFIEELAGEAAAAGGSDTMDTDSSDNQEDEQESIPFFNDLAFLMSGGRLRDMVGGAETLLQQVAWALAGGAGRTGNTAPVLLVGAPGDYVLGGEGLDAVVTQLLGQLEGSGPPPMPTEQLRNIELVVITEQQVASGLQCSVCWDHFVLGEPVSRLACQHVFHAKCIDPWLRLHATCPICRHCLLARCTSRTPEGEAGEAPAGEPENPSGTTLQSSRLVPADSGFRMLEWGRASSSPPVTSSSSASTASATDTDTDTSRSQYNMELDFD